MCTTPVNSTSDISAVALRIRTTYGEGEIRGKAGGGGRLPLSFGWVGRWIFLDFRGLFDGFLT